MQLIAVMLIVACLFLTGELKAQLNRLGGQATSRQTPPDSVVTELAEFEYPNWDAVDIDFLSSYYEQDGNNSPVTGGLGTEHLTDFTQKLIVSLPLKPRLAFKVDGGYDYYTSASSDMIDPVYSDDSGYDTRVHGNVGIVYKIDSRQTFGARLGGSGEYDYSSVQAGLSYTRLSENENTSLDLRFQSFVDQWSLIYPIELRNTGVQLDRSDRQSYNFAAQIQQVLTRRTQVSVQLEATMMNGLLSTPFHRVYFGGENIARLERLPSTRLKIPVGVRVNHYLSDKLLVRASYRYYWDDWGIQAHTVQLELPLKLNRFLSVVPSYRYHTQTAADYFLPFQQHSPGSEFYTSDYDLAALNSHAFGLGVNYTPAGGLFKVKLPMRKEKSIYLNGIHAKAAHYRRSTNFHANIVSFGMGFTIK